MLITANLPKITERREERQNNVCWLRRLKESLSESSPGGTYQVAFVQR